MAVGISTAMAWGLAAGEASVLGRAMGRAKGRARGQGQVLVMVRRVLCQWGWAVGLVHIRDISGNA